MRKILSVFITTLILLPVAAYATWQVADPFHGSKLNRELQPAATIHQSDVPKVYRGKRHFSFMTKKTWLKTNLTIMAKEHGWTVNWKAYRNYQVLLKTRLVGSSFPDTANELLSHYPVKAYYNRRMRTMRVVDTQHSRYYSR